MNSKPNKTVRKPSQTGHKYRPEIDGLRAVAIVPVLLFHTGLPGFGGGFVGVDVFFVISGFLITRQILSDLATGTFSLVQFWTRRARRIIPAIAVVVTFSLVAGWFLFFPSNYRDLGRSAAAQSVFASNIFFWLKAGYFTAHSETKPLLHTWTLSVEEQFYLCIPLLLWFLARWRDRFRIGSLFGLLLGSFLLSVWSTFTHPEAGFYLLHSRGWELLIGCLVAMLDQRQVTSVPCRPWMKEILSGAGLLAILAAVVQYNSRTQFPGFAALLPCGGAAAIIYANASQTTFAGRLLARRSFVWIGLISYSLYLWHWPLLAFARYTSIEPLSLSATIAVIAASFPIAWLSYRFVETPFRRGPSFRRALIVLPGAGMILALLLVGGLYIAATGGVAWRPAFQVTAFEADIRPASQRADLCEPVQSAAVAPNMICRLGPVTNTKSKVMLIGDSFAGMYLEAFGRLSAKFNREVWYVKDQNAPLEPDILNAISTGQVSEVVLAYSWRRALQAGIPELSRRDKAPHKGSQLPKMYSNWTMKLGYDPLTVIGDPKETFRKDLTTLVQELSNRGIRVFLLDAPPYYPVSVPLKLGLLVKRGSDPTHYGSQLQAHKAELRFIHEVFRELNVLTNVQVVRPSDMLCDQTGFCRTYADGHSLYSDDAHLSEYGAGVVEPLLVPIFDRFEK